MFQDYILLYVDGRLMQRMIICNAIGRNTTVPKSSSKQVGLQ